LLFLIIFFATVRRTPGACSVWYVLCFLVILYAAASLYFSYISSTKINAYCILCLLSYVINFSLLFFCFIIIRRFGNDSFVSGLIKGTRYIFRHRVTAICIITLFAGFLLLRLLLPPYWLYSFPDPGTAISSGLTEDGHPWIGAKSPVITIHEYADYQCFQCGKMHLFLRQLVNRHPEKLRLVHHHYPLDHEFNSLIVPEPFHIGSGKMAMIAIYASAKGKFWQMNDALYSLGRAKQHFNTRTLAAMTGFSPGELTAATNHEQIREFLLTDIRSALKYGIFGTPSYVIDGQAYLGRIPPEVITTIME
jgi:protein-disulfide isomerase